MSVRTYKPCILKDLYGGPIAKLLNFTIAAYQENPAINLEVFVHKAEANTDEYRIGMYLIAYTVLASNIEIENFRHIQQRVLDELLDESPEYEQIPINFHLTSIYDHSLHEAFSRVLQKLVGSLPYLEDLLNVFCAVSFVSLTSSFITYASFPHRTRKRLRHICLMFLLDFTLLQMHRPLTIHTLSAVTTCRC